MTDSLVPGSFRDPSGFLFTRDGLLYRQVNESFREDYEMLMSSGLYRGLVDDGLLVPHEEVDPSRAAAPGAFNVIKPELVSPITYPYEWSFAQLKDAARATLEIHRRAMAAGMSLRDASAYNMQFHRGRWTLIDTLSLGRYREGEPWVAYRQFCQHFLAPLALMRYRDVRLGQLSRVHLDGVPVDLAAALLPRRTRFRPGLGIHIHAHARAQRRYASTNAATQEKRKRRIGKRALEGLIGSLARAVEKLDWKPESHWVDYYVGDSYTSDGFEHKKKLVSAFLDGLDARVAWDIGANTGVFSRIVADRGIQTLSLEADHASVHSMYRELVAEEHTDVIPLLFDLTNPGSGMGWDATERSPLRERSTPDLVLALALVHHIAIANNVPLDRIANTLHALAPSLIIEFVPKSDPKTQLLLSSREDVFPGYTQEGFERAFGARFTIERSEKIVSSERTLYLMRAR